MSKLIKVTRLNNQEFYLNSDLIEFIEETPDTVISLTTGKKIVIVESIDQVINEILEYRRAVYINLPITAITENRSE